MTRAERRSRRSPFSSKPGPGAASVSCPSAPRANAEPPAHPRRMVPGMGTRRCRSSGQPPASCQRASTRSWRATMTSRSLRASARVRPLPRHRHQQPRRLVIEIEMPGNAAGAPLRAAARNRVTPRAGLLTVSRLRS